MARKYDAADFVVPPQIGKGESERVQCRVQQGHVRALKILANSGVFPYQAKEDVMRWCIKFGLNELARLEPSLIKSVMSMANAADEIAKDHLFHQKYTEVFIKLHEGVSYYTANGMPEQAIRMITKVRGHYEAIPETNDFDRMWRARYLKGLAQYDYLEQAVKSGAPIPPPPPKPVPMTWDDDAFSTEMHDDDETYED